MGGGLVSRRIGGCVIGSTPQKSSVSCAAIEIIEMNLVMFIVSPTASGFTYIQWIAHLEDHFLGITILVDKCRQIQPETHIQ